MNQKLTEEQKKQTTDLNAQNLTTSEEQKKSNHDIIINPGQLDQQLKESVTNDDIDQIKLLLSKGANPNWKDPNDVSESSYL